MPSGGCFLARDESRFIWDAGYEASRCLRKALISLIWPGKRRSGMQRGGCIFSLRSCQLYFNRLTIRFGFGTVRLSRTRQNANVLQMNPLLTLLVSV